MLIHSFYTFLLGTYSRPTMIGTGCTMMTKKDKVNALMEFRITLSGYNKEVQLCN